MSDATPAPFKSTPEGRLCAFSKMYATDAIAVAGAIWHCHCQDEKPTRYQLDALRRLARSIDESIDEYERATTPEATVEIVDTAEAEHQTDIEDGVASFEAYRAKKEAV